MTIVELLARYWKHAKRYYRKGGKPTGEVQNIRYAIRPLKAALWRRYLGIDGWREFGEYENRSAVHTPYLAQSPKRTVCTVRAGNFGAALPTAGR